MAEFSQLPPVARIRYIRLKDLGTRLASEDIRNSKIIKYAKPLPEGKRLPGRSIYWFVSVEPFAVACDANLFIFKEPLVIPINEVNYHLYQIHFTKNRSGILTLIFPDGSAEQIHCYSTAKKPDSSALINPITDRMYYDAFQFDSDSNTNQSIEFPNTFSPQNSPNVDQLSPITPDSSYVQNKRMKINHDPEIAGLPNMENPAPGILQVLAHNAANYNNNNNNNANITPPHDVVRSLPDHVHLIQNNTTLVHVYHNTPPKDIRNILLLVPDRQGYIEAVDRAMKEIGFVPDVSSSTNQRLYRDKDINNIENNILLFPYGDKSRIGRVPDYLVAATEVLLMLENDGQQQEDFMAIKLVENIKNNADKTVKNWNFTMRGAKFKPIELDFQDLNTYVQLLVPILQDSVTGGAIWKNLIDNGSLQKNLEFFFLEWFLRKYEPGKAPVPLSNIYVCFKYENKVKPLSEYAAITLKALNITAETFGAVGSALVYLKCPSYFTWYILINEERIASELVGEGLKEIYECGTSDIDASLLHPANEEFIDELTYLKEMMIADGIEDQIVNRFRVVFDSLLVTKFNALKAFDHKWPKTLKDYSDWHRLKQQLFGFNTEEKNVRFAVRVFVASASAGMATNVAKLMRLFNGKSIVDGVHSGLQIANTIVEWNQSGLVHIGELKHTNATAVLFDVQDSVKFDFNDEIANKMINFIQRWNFEHQYSPKDYNSHRFVRDFLQETLNVSLVERFKGPLGSYMDYVMRTGDTTPRLISKTHGTLVFKTHQELEEADKQIHGKLSDEENKLLKIFHRGFQLQEAAHGKDVSNCCYGLPTNGLEVLNVTNQ